MSDKSDCERDKRLAIIKHHVEKLGEHFDHVQVFCSTLECQGEETASFSSGSGNWHARRNQAREWVDYHDEQVRNKARRDESDCGY